MNVTSFNLAKSKTQYDVYKYKLDNFISYNKRKIYRYKVSNIVYDLRTEDFYKYLIKVEVDSPTWKKFKSERYWEYFLTSFDLLSLIINHLEGLLELNSFKSINLPEELEDIISFTPDYKSERVLNVSWFNNFTSVSKNTLNLVIFTN